MDYTWSKFLHLVGVLAFFASHGVSMFVALKLRKERDRDRIKAMLQLSGATVGWLYASLALLVGGGVLVSFKGGFWGSTWLWISIGILIFVTVLMIGMARPYYRRIRESLALRPSGIPRVSDEDLAARLMSPVPLISMWLGWAGLLAILYLMVFKRPL